jgi:hypothetical protein
LCIGKAHEDDLMRYFGVAKTLDVLYEYFYWPKMKSDMQIICDRCIACRQAKSRVLPYGLYTSLLVSKKLWVDISITLC